MLSSVEITNYRGFESYRMRDLARVNLLVGKNNCGKTALLEGIHFLSSNGDPSVLAEIAQRRGEVIVGRHEPKYLVDICHFFNGHMLVPNTSFSLQGDNGHAPVTVRIVLDKNGDSDRPQRASKTPGLYLKIHVGSSKGEKGEQLFRISRDGGVNLEISPLLRRMGSYRRPHAPEVRFVGPDSLSPHELAMMWDDITLTGQEADIAEAMRILDPDFCSVHFLTGMLASGYFSGRGGIVVGMRDQATRVPLGSMGDGMRRLISLAAALAFTKQGCLFADEIDTGLHYAVMPDMWKLLISKAIHSNIQVFATTHSWDCIAGLSVLCQRDPELAHSVAIHKIDRGIPQSVPFTGEAIVRMVKSDIDPR